MMEPAWRSIMRGMAYLQGQIDAPNVDGHDLIQASTGGVHDRMIGLGHDPGVVVEHVERSYFWIASSTRPSRRPRQTRRR